MIYLTEMLKNTPRAAGWLALAFIGLATLSPIQDRPVIASAHVEHFAAFALVGLALTLGYPSRTILVLVTVAGSAVVLEILQLFTPDRHGRLVDTLMKIAGGLSGIGAGELALILTACRRKFRIEMIANYRRKSTTD